MHKKILIFSAVAMVAFPPVAAFAQIPDQAVKQAEKRAPIRAELKTEREQVRVEKAEFKQQVETKKEAMAQKRLELQDRKEKMVEEKCKNIEAKIETRIGRYENNGQMLQKVYGNMKTRLERLTARLKSTGVDTTQLEKDLATLYGQIDKLQADQATFMTTLKESQSFVCGKSEGEFKGKLEQARKVPETIKQDREDIKKFFQTTIKADLQAVKAQLEKQAAQQVKTRETKETTDSKKDSVRIEKQKKNSTTITAGSETSTSSSSSTSSSTSTSTSSVQ